MRWPFATVDYIACIDCKLERLNTHFDAKVAAIAQSTGASIAIRNVCDFDGYGIDAIDPCRRR
jgi:alpha-beta hydrolase superfamily lysophospholipase